MAKIKIIPNERQALERMSVRCAKSELCEADVRRKLADWGQDSAATDRIVARLREEGFIDDARYCRAFVEDKWNFNRWGRTKIRMALRAKGFDNGCANDALAVIDDGEYRSVLAALLRERGCTLGDDSAYVRAQKLIRFALGRGFEIDAIRDCLGDGGEP